MHFKKLNPPEQRSNEGNQSLLASSSFNLQTLQFAKLSVFEIYYIFHTEFCDVNKLEELKMNTDSLYLALPKTELEDCIQPELKTEWQSFWSKDCTDNFTADIVENFFPRSYCDKHKELVKGEPGLFLEKFRLTEKLCSCCKNY